MTLPFGLPSLDLRALKQCLKNLLAHCLALCYSAMIALTSSVRQQPPHLHAKDLEASSAIDHHHLALTSPTSLAHTSSSNHAVGPSLSAAPVGASLSSSSSSSSAPVTPSPTMQTGNNNNNSNGHNEQANKRPKLSLQTACVPTTSFGKSTTTVSFSVSTQTASSPTVKNTWNNTFTYDGFKSVGSATTTTTTTTSPAAHAHHSAQESPSSKHPSKTPSHLGRATHTSAGGGGDGAPYQLPLGVRSILRNSPVATILSSKQRPSSLSGPAASGRKKLFPATKRVNYRFPIDEEITTVRFVARHSDLLSPEEPSDGSDATASSSEEDSDGDSSSSGSSSESTSSDEDMDQNDVDYKDVARGEREKNDTESGTHRTTRRRRKGKYRRSEKQVLAAGVRDGLIDPLGDCQTPPTPVKRRRKKPRQWRWTLGPIKDGYVQPTSHEVV